MELHFEDNHIIVSAGGEKLLFLPGSGVTSFIRLGLDEINRLYNEVIISCIGAGQDLKSYRSWAERKLLKLEKSCFYMSYYNGILKKIITGYLEGGTIPEPHGFYSAIPELKKQSLLNYVNQEIDTVSRNKVLINFISQKAFDNMTEAEKDNNCKALMRFLYFRDAILYNISALQKSCVKKISAVFSEGGAASVYIFSLHSWYAFDDKQNRFTETIKIERAEQLVDIEIMKLANGGDILKECQSCGRYFVPHNRVDTIYCSHINKETGKSCSQTGAAEKLRGKIEGSPAHQAYNKAYKRYFARVKAGKLDNAKFKKWKDAARKRRDKCAEGKISIEEFTIFLEELN